MLRNPVFYLSMKRSVLFLFSLLLSVNLFSQAYRFSDESAIFAYKWENYYGHKQESNFNYISDIQYVFEANEKLFMVAYEKDISLKTRALFLFRLDKTTEWVKASDTMQIDYWYTNTPFIDYFLPGEGHTHYSRMNTHSRMLKRGLGGGSVNKTDNGIVVISIRNDYTGNPTKIHRVEARRGNEETDKKCKCCRLDSEGIARLEGNSYDYDVLIFLVPNGNETYVATRFEPKLKKTYNSVLAAMHSLNITTIDDGLIKLELWNKVVCPDNNCDGILEIDGDGGIQKVGYNLDMSEKLYFVVNDDRTVSYVKGTAELIQKF